MISFIKNYWYYIVGGIVVAAVLVFLRDADRAAMLASFFKRKRVEEDVNKIKESLAVNNADIKANDDQLADLALHLKAQKVEVKNANDEEIKDFYEKYFKNK